MKILFGMKVQVVWEVLEVSNTVSKSQNWNNYFSFKIKDYSNPAKWIINSIKCFFMMKDLFKGEELAKSIQKWDIVMVSWWASFQAPLNPQPNNTWIFMTIFVDSVSVVVSKAPMQATNESFTETRVPSQNNTIIETKEAPSEIFTESIWSLLDDILNNNDDLPY